MKKIIGYLLSLAVLLLAFPMETFAEEEVYTESAYETAALQEMKLMAENESLEFYFDETETDFAVRRKDNGALWFSNPVDMDLDAFSTSYYKKVLKSQLVLTYINESTQVSTMNNYVASVEEGQFEVEKLENGVRVTYLIGESTATLLLPEAISEERMITFTERMTDSQLRKINRNYTLYNAAELEEETLGEMLRSYPTLAETPLYILRSGTKDYLREELAGYFEEAGYTREDLDGDNANIGETEEDDSVWFQVPVTYTIEGENLVVSVNPEEITYNDNGYYLVSLDLLRYFGASLSEDGYLFVPDGSGALINFNNGKTSVSSYSAQVYGQDKTMLSTAYYQSQIDAQSTIKMPVFGIRDGDKALFAIIEGGDGYATINADIAGKTTGYNDTYASFTYLQYGATSLDDIVGANSYYMYSEAAFEGDYTIRYSFLSGEEADYSGMANVYREYLTERGVLTELVTEQNIPFYAEYIGAIEKPKTIMGIKYDALEAVTTYAQAKEITDALQAAGVDSVDVIYTGWMNEGLHGTAATKLSPLSILNKGGVSLTEFQNAMSEQGNDLYMTVDFQYVYRDELFDGYSTLKYAPRYFDNTTAAVLQYGFASRVSEGSLADLISPYFAQEIASALTGKLARKQVTGVNLGTMSWELYSDLDETKYVDRQMAITNYQSSMGLLAGSDINLLADNGNAYTWEYAQDMINAPLASNYYKIIDAEIPFYEMVIHGYLQYAGEAINLADDYRTCFLKSVESGAGLHFQWIYANNSVLKETDYDELYSVHYGAWMERAVESYKQMNESMGALQGQTIRSHEIVMKDVVKVTYEDGTAVYVNYTDESVSVDGITIAPMDFTVK